MHSSAPFDFSVVECSFVVFDLQFGEKLVEFSRAEMKTVVSVMLLGKSPSREDIRSILSESVHSDV